MNIKSKLLGRKKFRAAYVHAKRSNCVFYLNHNLIKNFGYGYASKIEDFISYEVNLPLKCNIHKIINHRVFLSCSNLRTQKKKNIIKAWHYHCLNKRIKTA